MLKNTWLEAMTPVPIRRARNGEGFNGAASERGHAAETGRFADGTSPEPS